MLATGVRSTFRLSDNFIAQYQGRQPSWGFGDLSYFTYKRTYARVMANGEQEEFVDTLERVVNGCFRTQEKHCKMNGLPWNAHKAQHTAQEMFELMWAFKFIPPGRGLWMMGTEHVEKIGSAALNNCFSGDTEIAIVLPILGGMSPNIGVAKLKDLVGEEVILLNQEAGTFKPVAATIKSFGKQSLKKITFVPKGIRSKFALEYEATSNHRWILSDGTSTTSLKVGNTITIVPQEGYNKGSHNDTGFIHGLIFGDGTRHTYYPDRHFIRLCGAKEQKHVEILETHKNHLSTTYPQSLNGDAVVTIISDENLKALPLEHHDRDYLVGFVHGWLAADSHKNPSGTVTLDTQNLEAAQWLVKIAPLLGFTVTGWTIENEPTNFGPRSSPLNRITLSTQPVEYLVKEITDEGKEEEVYCPVVPNVNQFTLAGGIVTGNCGFISTKDLNVELGAPFAWAMDMLMLGVGIGFDTKGKDTETKIYWNQFTGATRPAEETDLDTGLHEFDDHAVYVVPDTREGWVESVRLCINSFARRQLPIFFDYRLVRKAGEPIKGFGGVSSGPAPLRECHNSIRLLLSTLNDKLISSTAIVDLFNLIGKCVVAGNVRRSAELAIGEINDRDYVEMKDWNLHPRELESHRWASNNSVFVNRFTDFSPIINNITCNGEPGLIFLDNARHYGRFKDGWIDEADDRFDDVDGFNPCAEQQLVSKELCCLVETFPSNHDSIEDYHRTLKFAYLYAKTVTLIPTHDERTNTVMVKNRRIGCSMSGIQQAIVKFGRQAFFDKICDLGYSIIKSWDRVYSRWLGIPRSIKMTCVKPSGTVSLLAGVLPGVHFGHSQSGFRTIRLAANSTLLPILLDAGYRVEFSATDKDKLTKIQESRFKSGAIDRFIVVDEDHITNNVDQIVKLDINRNEALKSWLPEFAAATGTVVVYFPVMEKNFSKTKFETTIWEQLNTVREMQYYWADNAVSCTVTVKDDERDQLQGAIEFAAPYVKTLSFLPLTDHHYEQAPYQEAGELEVSTYASSLKRLDLSGKTNTSITGSKFCDGDKCEI